MFFLSPPIPPYSLFKTGVLMVMFVYLAGIRLAWWDLSDRVKSPLRRGCLCVLLALPAHLLQPLYKILLLVAIYRIKCCKKEFVVKETKNIAYLQEKMRSCQLIEAQWESLPQLILTSAKIGEAVK